MGGSGAKIADVQNKRVADLTLDIRGPLLHRPIEIREIHGVFSTRGSHEIGKERIGQIETRAWIGIGDDLPLDLRGIERDGLLGVEWHVIIENAVADSQDSLGGAKGTVGKANSRSEVFVRRGAKAAAIG